MRRRGVGLQSCRWTLSLRRYPGRRCADSYVAVLLNASNDPLIVIDGLTIDNETPKGMSNFGDGQFERYRDSHRFEGCSATAIYGSRASNGALPLLRRKVRADLLPKYPTR